MSIKLTDTQLVVLSAAAQRKDRCLVAPPTLKGGAAQRVANKLISSGLVKEVKAKTDDPVWRRDEESGAPYALKLTAAGAKAIVADEGAEPENANNEGGVLENHSQLAVPSETAAQVAPSAAMEPVAAGPSAPRSGSKLARVIELLQRDHGATIDELIEERRWGDDQEAAHQSRPVWQSADRVGLVPRGGGGGAPVPRRRCGAAARCRCGGGAQRLREGGRFRPAGFDGGSDQPASAPAHD